MRMLCFYKELISFITIKNNYASPACYSFRKGTHYQNEIRKGHSPSSGSVCRLATKMVPLRGKMQTKGQNLHF